LFVLLVLLAGSRAESWEVVVLVVFLGGFLLWLCGREAVHIGASGLIAGLGAFLIVSGFLEHLCGMAAGVITAVTLVRVQKW
jgi:hypothetical protein